MTCVSMNGKVCLRSATLALLLFASFALPTRAPAAFVFTLSQVGADVEVAGSGMLNLADLSLVAEEPNAPPRMTPVSAILSSGAVCSTCDVTPAKFPVPHSGLVVPPTPLPMRVIWCSLLRWRISFLFQTATRQAGFSRTPPRMRTAPSPVSASRRGSTLTLGEPGQTPTPSRSI